jgi:predicted nucleic acid-binding protein
MAGRPVKVFLDSNVILSGLISEIGAPRIILDLLSLGLPQLAGATGRYNLMETERNLAKRMPALIPIYQDYLPKMRLVEVPLPTAGQLQKHSGLAPAKDLPVLVSALRWHADFLVTGDKKYFEKAKRDADLPLRIVTPTELIEALAERMT